MGFQILSFIEILPSTYVEIPRLYVGLKTKTQDFTPPPSPTSTLVDLHPLLPPSSSTLDCLRRPPPLTASISPPITVAHRPPSASTSCSTSCRPPPASPFFSSLRRSPPSLPFRRSPPSLTSVTVEEPSKPPISGAIDAIEATETGATKAVFGWKSHSHN